MRIKCKSIIYNHDGYCSGDEMAIDCIEYFVDYNCPRKLYEDCQMLDSAAYQLVDMRMIDSIIESFIRGNKYVIKYNLYHDGSGYCDFITNHDDFIADDCYDLIKNMGMLTGYLVIYEEDDMTGT